MLRELFPDYHWISWKFPKVRPGFWNELPNQRKYCDWLFEQLQIKSFDDFCKVTISQLLSNYGWGVANIYSNSISKLLINVYPEYKWEVWKFRKLPNETIQQEISLSDKILKNYIDYLSQKLKIEKLEDWYRVSVIQLERCGGTGLLVKHGGLPSILNKIYPEFSWNNNLFGARGSKSTQRYLKVLISELLGPTTVILEDYIHPKLKFPSTLTHMQLDIFLPHLTPPVAFEYQGAQHYQEIYYMGGYLSYQENDRYKREACKQEGIDLIEIPYWWNLRKESLAATIFQNRPDLFPSSFVPTSPPIPTTPPKRHQKCE